MKTGSLGDVIFEAGPRRVFTPSSFGMGRDARYEEHEVQGAFSRSEFLAPGVASATLSMTLRRDLGCDPATEAKKLEDMMLRGEVLRLIIGGRNLGRWTIRKVDQSWRHLASGGGGPFALTLSVELKEYF